jgi:hypothetical protein
MYDFSKIKPNNIILRSQLVNLCVLICMLRLLIDPEAGRITFLLNTDKFIVSYFLLLQPGAQ